jgi:basic membrane lipoprotein Med (substrate-binding protein (PBP1-ABC) superfamily)
MKKLLLTTLLLLCFTLIGFAQDTTQTNKHKPKAVYKVGAAKITVWENNGKNGTWKNFKVEKIYMKDDEWKTSSSFNEKELLDLKAAIDKAIAEENIKQKNTEVNK